MSWLRTPIPAVAALCLAISILTGCPPRQATPTQLPSNAGGEWPFRPASIIVHPLTRYWIAKGQEREVEARVEFMDKDGFPTRGIGRLELTLESNDGRVVESWVLALSNLDTNRAHFDNVTRTYLVRLSLPKQDMPEQAELLATLVLPDGQRLSATGEVGAAPKPREPKAVESQE
ncbi:MAG: hypothetical protein MK116_09025 [Phycisphaerales bacterium]|nr:hypothetical protein [Phycisphaerales bacterium]